MSEQPRITVEAIREAMERTGLEIICRSWGDGTNCGCPQMILYRAAGGESGQYAAEDWVRQKYGYYYSIRFRQAFDGKDVERYLARAESQLGYADGLAARRELLGKG